MIAAGSTKADDRSKPIESRRGLALEDWPDGYVWMLAKTDAVTVAEAIAQARDGEVVRDALGKSLQQDKVQTITCQFKGHSWSVFGWFERKEPGKFAKQLSRDLGVDVIMVAYSDFTGWQFIDTFRGGEHIEAFHWGLDDLNPSGSWDVKTSWDTDYGDGVVLTDILCFRSSLHQATEEQVQRGDDFADWLLRQHDAYLAKSEAMAWINPQGKVESSLGPEAFSAVVAVMR